MIGLIATVYKYNKYFEPITQTFVADSLDIARDILINFISSNINNLQIDYPLDIDDFEYIWFDNQYIKCDLFSYKIFMDNKWLENNLWGNQEIYTDVLQYMFVKEIIELKNVVQDYDNENENENENENKDDNEINDKNDEEKINKMIEIMKQQLFC